MTYGSTFKSRLSAPQFFLGGIGLVLVTFVCFRLGLDAGTTGFAYLILIVLLALIGSFIGSVLLSILAVGCLSYFFAPPLFSFRVDYPADALAIAAFLTTSFLVNGLIAQRRRTEGDLRQSETCLAEAERVSHTGSFGWRVASGKIIWSEETFRIFECDRAIKPTWELMLQRTHPEDRALVQDLLERMSHEGEDWEIEHRLLMPHGSVKHVRTVAHAVKDALGELEFVGAIMDITATRRAEEELHQARMELSRVARVSIVGELTAAVAHEINQPLTGVVSSGNACLRWLAGEPPDPQAARRSIERMLNDVNRAGEVISRIRALVRKAPPLQNRLNINDTIMEVTALIGSEVQRNGISLRTELSNDLPLVLGDRIQLQQVILNLIMNAIEAMSGLSQGPRELSIASAKDGSNGVRVEVRDSGTGLDSTALGRLFEAFYTTKPDGMGMGLAISRTIIEAHGGRLWAAPNAPQGAVFQFTLPIDGEEVSLSKQMQSP